MSAAPGVASGGSGPALVFLPGYMSDMAGGKATAVFEWAQENGRACLLLDYSGCGASDGAFADGTLSRWGDEVCGLMDHLRLTQVMLVGSSMGGWLMLLVALKARQSVRGLVGIAAAPDFTEWGFTPQQKTALMAGEIRRRFGARQRHRVEQRRFRMHHAHSSATTPA